MKRSRGVTILELMVTITIIAVLSTAVTRAFIVGLNYEMTTTATRERFQSRNQIEDKMIDLLQHAYLAANQADTTTYFEATSSGESTSNTGDADTLNFTVQGQRVSGALIASKDDFESINDRYGPVGGVTEIGLSTSAVGDSGNSAGLFLRRQSPSDSEPTQGGTESILDPDITSVEFEFWDGTAWQPTWTTQTGDTKRLPAAVKVIYTRTEDDVAVERTLIVRLPLSDVTADNPAPQTGTPAGGAQ